MLKRDEDTYSDAETQQRLKKMLKSAFAGAPTPLKDIPTAEGKTRKLGGKAGQVRRRRLARQRKKRAA